MLRRLLDQTDLEWGLWCSSLGWTPLQGLTSRRAAGKTALLVSLASPGSLLAEVSLPTWCRARHAWPQQGCSKSMWLAMHVCTSLHLCIAHLAWHQAAIC